MTCCFDSLEIVSSSMFCLCDLRSSMMMSVLLVNVDWGSLGRTVETARPEGVWYESHVNFPWSREWANEGGIFVNMFRLWSSVSR